MVVIGNQLPNTHVTAVESPFCGSQQACSACLDGCPGFGEVASSISEFDCYRPFATNVEVLNSTQIFTD